MKVKIFIAILPALVFYISSCQNQEVGKVSLKTNHDSVAYIIGHNIGINLIASPMTEINIKAVAKGMQDALDEIDLFMDPNMANMFLNQYMQDIDVEAKEKHLQLGREFLEDNAQRKGVTTTESGLQYEILVEGNGPKPTDTSTVVVHYHGTLFDGDVFDSSIERGEPAEFGVNQVIPGWTEALKIMPVGSKWRIFLPTELAYGENPRPGGVIKPNDMLIFDIELLEIK